MNESSPVVELIVNKALSTPPAMLYRRFADDLVESMTAVTVLTTVVFS